MAFGDAVHGPMVYKQLQEHIQVELVDRFFEVVHVRRELNFVLHVIDFLLSWVVAHAAHHIGDGF